MPDPVATTPAMAAEPSVPSVPSAPVTVAALTSSALPTVDLSASLGAQVVDMGVSGQWIDGLARDMAGLSANGAQGRFQIHTDQLGAVQVDIRHGGDGAAVSLTVANEAAELALKQDSERLKVDAGLASVRIADVKVERAPITEASRADSAGQQSSQQQSQSHQSSAQNQFASAHGNPNMGHPQGQQSRWQARENNGIGPKSSGDPAVLNHAEARSDAGESRRTRYA
jgi:flagellar hook-length control protein FliK